MLYALKHPARTVRWWRYRVAYALAERRRALATLRGEQRARRALAEASREAVAPVPERGEVIGRAFIGRDGDVRDLTDAIHHDPRFDPRPPLVPRDASGRLSGW
jgi:regulator of protease activity HflC (stomatin/prohibitin superfamily)